MTKEQAVKLFNSGWWKDRTPEDLVSFQLFESRLCMPFDVFHQAVEKALGRPVWTHEFAGKVGAGQIAERIQVGAGFEEICNLIPEEENHFGVINHKGENAK